MEIVKLVDQAGFKLRENSLVCIVEPSFYGALNKKTKELIICTENIKRSNRKSFPNVIGEEKTEAHKHIRETLRHEAVHIAQYCNKNKTINSLNDKSYQLNDYRKKLALLSTKVSGQREKEIEAYWMESKPYKVKDAIEKYCL